MNLQVLDDPAAAVADLLVAASGDIVITGGSSPQRAYELAAERRADWTGVTVWFTDERCVPPDHELSNFAMVERAWFSRVERPPGWLRMPGELGPERGAAAYEAELGHDTRFELMLLGLGPDAHIASLFPNRPEKHVTDRTVVAVPEAGAEAYAEVLGDTQFGLMLLGLGPDAHIASLFPNRPEKYVTDRRVVAVPQAGLEPFVPRISLTRPAINGAREKIFLITGANKVEAVRRAFGDDPEPDLVAAHIRSVALYLDAAAAGR